MIKKKIFVFFLAIIIYLFSIFVYNQFKMSNEYIYAYVLNTDLKDGEKIERDKVSEISVSKNSLGDIELFTKDRLNDDIYCKGSMRKGKILENRDVITQSQRQKANSNYENISLKIDNVDDFLSYQLNKYDMVNIYFTYKNSDIKSIDFGGSCYSSENGYTSIKILENIGVLDIYDKYGNSIDKKNSSDNVPDNIMINVESDIAIKLKTIKNLGKFSLSM